ncbi:hypothetical protein BaRGS_00009855 [Batillaria attramentaria]|uniref:Uncharacterized protein n=1 Tax=Batillaria attramentaria TaxID=370345 RepID=A0ABD0LHV5_9CAEN
MDDNSVGLSVAPDYSSVLSRHRQGHRKHMSALHSVLLSTSVPLQPAAATVERVLSRLPVVASDTAIPVNHAHHNP